jgi:hypothetical protein
MWLCENRMEGLKENDNIGHGGDAGERYEGRCPDCGNNINVATSQWWEERCICGHLWRLEINIKGE